MHLGFTTLDLGRIVKAFVILALLGPGAATAQRGTLTTAVRDGSDNLRLISWELNLPFITRSNELGASAGDIRQLAAVRVDDFSEMATAVRDNSGDLLVILWRDPLNGQIQRLSSGKAGRVSRVAAAANRDRVVTAVRNGSGNLQVIGWQVTREGAIRRVAPDAAAGPIDIGFPFAPRENVVAATFLSETLLATAVRGQGGNLRINTWRVGLDGKVAPLHEASAGTVGEVSAVALGENRLVTAVQDGGGNLLLIAWNVDQLGNITRGRQFQAGTASQISTVPLFGPRLATAVKNGAGNLLIITFEVPPGNNPIVRLQEARAGEVSRISATPCGIVLNGFVFQTSVRGGGDKLNIIAWKTSLDGRTITRNGDTSAGAVSLVGSDCSI